MPLRVELPPTLRDRLAVADRPLIGLWACAGSPITAEIVAGSGCDWVLLDAEHSPNGLESVLAQLYAMSAYPVAPLVRPPYGDTVTIKQFLDLGAQNLLIPMVDSAEQAAEIVRAVRYPDGAGGGARGVGSALYGALLSELEREDVHRAYAGIAMPNPASVRLHERCGFRRAGYFTEQGRKFGRYWDVAWFERGFPEVAPATSG